MPAKSPFQRTGSEYRTAKAIRIATAKANDEPCCRCHLPIDWSLHFNHRLAGTLEHLTPVVLSGREVFEQHEAAVSHRKCNSSAGATIGNRIRKLKNGPGVFPEGNAERPAPIYESHVHREGSPRFLSESPPNVAGTLADELLPWLTAEGIDLRPWQRLVFRAALEVDSDGNLVWRTVVVTVPRQSGKSWLLKGMALARISHPHLFGDEPQLAVSIASKHIAARRIHTQAWGWAGRRGLTVRSAMGGERIICEDGSSWDVQTTSNVYGASVNLLLLDEVWGISSEQYREGIRPTQTARAMPQLWAFSTAHRATTTLMPELIEQGRQGIGRTLLADWGSLPTEDPADPRTWRAASPWWDAEREDEMRLVAGTAGFQEQWLNVFPAAEEETDGRWLPQRATDLAKGRVGNPPDNALAALEVTQDGRRWAVSMAWPHGRKSVRARVWTCDSAREALLIIGSRRTWAHPAVIANPDMKHRSVTPINVSIGKASTNELRELLLGGHLVVAGMTDDDWAAIRTTNADGGEVIYAPKSTGDVHCAKALAWAVYAVQSERNHLGLVM